ncbi:MAG TPA: hypothetical protein VF556_00630 [Pyrinomonadaceae bacterium]|jgi:hypothetical protein
MKLIVLFLALTAILFGSGVCVQAQSAYDTFRIGNKQIVIPNPVGFTEASSQIQVIRDRFTVTEAAGNDLLAVHIPNDDYQFLKKGRLVDLTFYTKVSVSKKLKDETVSETNFANIIEAFEKNFPTFSDPKGSEMKKILNRISENLSGFNQEKTAVFIDKPQNLGEIVKERNSYGSVVLSQVKTKIGETEQVRTLLMGISAIRVREKVIFIYTYKEYKNEQDIIDLKNFSSN